MAAVMGAVFVVLFRETVRYAPVSVGYVQVAVAIVTAFGVTGVAALAFLRAPQGLWAPVPFALVSLLIMLVEALLLARWALGHAVPAPPAPRPAPSRVEESSPPSVSG